MPERLLGEQRDEIERRIAAASSLVLYLDLDATIGSAAPASQSRGFELEAEAIRILEELSRLEGVLVCVMSGGPVAELKQKVDIPGLVFCGDHGLEVESEAFRFVHPEAARCRGALEALNQRLSGLPLLVPGVETKARPLATTVRFDPEEVGVREQLGSMIRSLILAERLDLRVAEGIGNFEICPGLDWDEGAAIAWVYQRIKTIDPLALVIGGATTEESVFRAIDGAMTVQVAPGSSTQARYRLDRPEEVLPMIDWLRDRWTRRMNRADSAWPSSDVRPVLKLKEASPILNVRLRRAAIGRRRQALG